MYLFRLQTEGILTSGTEEKLMEGSTAAYVGIDPTADSLHISAGVRYYYRRGTAI